MVTSCLWTNYYTTVGLKPLKFPQTWSKIYLRRVQLLTVPLKNHVLLSTEEEVFKQAS